MLEAQSHEHSYFSTFTYEKEPPGGSLVKDHLTGTFHRLRERARTLSKTVRFFGVGEYGEQHGRPHYHAVIYGLGPSELGHVDASWQGINRLEDGSRAGYTRHFVLAPDLATYITGYIAKKWTAPDNANLAGRYPEFAEMSRRPGIGMPFILNLCEALNTSEGALYMARFGDVPTSFRCAGRNLPLGSYMRGKLREHFFGSPLQPRTGADYRGKLEHEKFLKHLPPLQVDATSFERLAAWSEATQSRRKEIKTTKMVRSRQVKGMQKIRNSRRTL